MNARASKTLTLATALVWATIAFHPCGLVAQRVLSEKEAVALTLQTSPVVEGAQLQVQQSRQLEGSSFNLANPEVFLESPTGEFFTIGVQQSFRFPTVYARQGRLAKVQTTLSENYVVLAKQDMIRQAREAFLAVQYTRDRALLFRSQDSIFDLIAVIARRQFEAGEADYLQQLYADLRAEDLFRQLNEAYSDQRIAHRVLQQFTGIQDSLVLPPLSRQSTLGAQQENMLDSTGRSFTPAMQYALQAEEVANWSLRLEKSKVLPGIVLGYLNQGSGATAFPLRWNVGVDVPIWFWQYKASIQAARTEQAIVSEITRAQDFQLMQGYDEAIRKIQKYGQSLDYFESAGLDKAEELTTTALRMYQAGQADAQFFLRSLGDAFQLKLEYTALLFEYNQSVIELQHLTGQ